MYVAITLSAPSDLSGNWICLYGSLCTVLRTTSTSTGRADCVSDSMAFDKSVSPCPPRMSFWPTDSTSSPEAKRDFQVRDAGVPPRARLTYMVLDASSSPPLLHLKPSNNKVSGKLQRLTGRDFQVPVQCSTFFLSESSWTSERRVRLSAV